MPAVAERSEARARTARERPRSTRRPAARRHVAGGVVWIAAAAVLLAGVVAMNVAVLRLNLRLDGLARERAKLRADNAALSSQLSSAAAAARIEALAHRSLGVVPADPSQTIYVGLGRRAR